MLAHLGQSVERASRHCDAHKEIWIKETDGEIDQFRLQSTSEEPTMKLRSQTTTPPDDPWFLPEVLSLLATQQQWQWINTQVQHPGTLLLTPYGCLWIFIPRQLPNMLQ